MAGFCSFSAILGGKCESSRGHTDCIALNDCDGDISLHLANHHLSRENSCERDLILARAGLLELTEEQIKNMMVCPAHRFTLGKYWQAPKTCQYPRHHRKKSAVTGTHVINFKLAREIKNLFGEAAPVGSLCSIIENTLEALKKEHPHITQVNFRSDEAGCYYNNFLVAAVRDAGNRVGITVTRYDFSEPQYGKDVCDRILCPMKSAIRRYCNEGHDVLSAKDMRTALSERPVRGTTASVCSVNESQKTLEVKMTDHFSRYHNFQFESNGIRIWRAYNVGQGRLIPYQDIIVKPQGPTDLVIDVDFFPVKEARIHNATSTDGKETSGLFSCPEPGCQMVFKKVSELENHLDVGEHRQMRGGSETVYDKLRRDWAEKFLNVDNNEERSSAPVAHCDERGDEFEYQAPSFCSDLQLGWALHKVRNQGVRFPDDVKQYLTILAATRRKQGNQELQMEDVYAEEEGEERREVLESVAAELSPRHPICYDSYCLCDLARDESLDSFSVVMLKEILRYFEIPFGSRDRKKI
ncbi:hypothetical protein ACROYT_G008123 [Oculina patagonica]